MGKDYEEYKKDHPEHKCHFVYDPDKGRVCVVCGRPDPDRGRHVESYILGPGG